MKVCESHDELPSKSDVQIWDEIKKGDTSALGRLYDLYIGDLFSYGIQLSQDRGHVMDCIHDLFLDLHKYRAKLATTDNAISYLLKSLKRKINKKYHRKILPAQKCFSDLIYPSLGNRTPSCEEEIICIELAAEKSAKLSTAIESLTKKQKKGLLLRFYQDRSYTEIAEIMEISIPTARTTIYRAIKILRGQPFSILI